MTFAMKFMQLEAIPVSCSSISSKNMVDARTSWRWGETESTWYVSHYLTYCTIVPAPDDG
jgi:hypothetical protein